MIYIYGDSHGNFNFKNLNLIHKNCYHNSITMFRIGRDNIIINFNKSEIKENDTIVLVYGEVDCRCHIQKQIDLGKDEDAVIREIVTNYFITIKNNVPEKTNIIIVGVVPPKYKSNDETKENNDIINMFPIVGTNLDRVRYTAKVNALLEEMSNIHNYNYFNPYYYYTSPDGTLKPELSDNGVHILKNVFFLEKFMELHKKINPHHEQYILPRISTKLNMAFT